MPCEPSRRIVGVRVGGAVAEEEADRRLHLLRPRRSAACAAARRGRCPARAATPGRAARAARPGPASSRGSGRRDTRPSAASARRSRAAGRPRRARASSRGAIDADVGVMHDARVAGMELDAADVARASVTGSGIAKMRNTSVGCAGSVKRLGGVTIRSGWPSSQPSANAAAAAGRARSPSGVPPAAQRSMRGDLAIGQPPLADEVRRRWASTFHGGMKRLAVTAAICAARRLDVVVGGEAERARPARPMARRARMKTIGAMSWVKVTSVRRAGGRPGRRAGAPARATPSSDG